MTFIASGKERWGGVGLCSFNFN